MGLEHRSDRITAANMASQETLKKLYSTQNPKILRNFQYWVNFLVSYQKITCLVKQFFPLGLSQNEAALWQYHHKGGTSN